MTKPSIDQNRKTITTLWASGTYDTCTIHELTSISLSTIYNYIKNGESLEHKPRSGRPENFNVVILANWSQVTTPPNLQIY